MPIYFIRAGSYFLARVCPRTGRTEWSPSVHSAKLFRTLSHARRVADRTGGTVMYEAGGKALVATH